MMMELKTKLLEASRAYTGPELRPHYILSETKLEGSSLIAFRGPCEVKTDHLVDWEDRLENDSIQAKEMVHFLGEFFGVSLVTGVFFQRLFVSILKEQIERWMPSMAVVREGDDLYWIQTNKDERLSQRYKLTVSIVTVSAVSSLFHLGLNLDATGAPVQAEGLFKMGLKQDQVIPLIQSVLTRVEQEWGSVMKACTKVRPV